MLRRWVGVVVLMGALESAALAKADCQPIPHTAASVCGAAHISCRVSGRLDAATRAVIVAAQRRAKLPVSLDLDLHGNLDALLPFLRSLPLICLELNVVQVDSAAQFESLKNLESLSFDAGTVDNLDPLRHLTKLTALDFYDLADGVSVEPLAALQNLRTLSISRHQASAFDATPIGKLPGLTHLALHRVGLDNLLFARGLPLALLNVSNNPKLSSLAGLENVATLRLLDASNTAVASLAPLASLRQLHTLSVWLTAVSDLAPLVGIPSLKELTAPCGLSPEQHQTFVARRPDVEFRQVGCR